MIFITPVLGIIGIIGGLLKNENNRYIPSLAEERALA